MQKIYFSTYDSKVGLLKIASTPEGVCRIGLPGESTGDCRLWLEKNFPEHEVIQSRGENSYVLQQLKEYFEGKRKKFDVKLNLLGTPFQKKVWKALMDIGYGKTLSYKDLAVKIGKPTAFRAVGNANAQNPVPIIIPCHRVIKADGKLGGYGGGLTLKKQLIEHELRYGDEC